MSKLHVTVAAKNYMETQSLILSHACARERAQYVNEPDDIGVMPIHYAVDENSPPLVSLLLRHGADSNADYSQMTPLHQAITREATQIAKILIRFGADVNGKDSFGDTALSYTLLYGGYEIAKEMIKWGADIENRNVDENTPLIYAAKHYVLPTVF